LGTLPNRFAYPAHPHIVTTPQSGHAFHFPVGTMICMLCAGWDLQQAEKGRTACANSHTHIHTYLFSWNEECVTKCPITSSELQSERGIVGVGGRAGRWPDSSHWGGLKVATHGGRLLQTHTYTKHKNINAMYVNVRTHFCYRCTCIQGVGGNKNVRERGCHGVALWRSFRHGKEEGCGVCVRFHRWRPCWKQGLRTHLANCASTFYEGHNMHV